MVTIYLLALCFLLFILKYEFQKWQTARKLKHFDGPPALPIVGNLLPLLFAPFDMNNIIKRIQEPFRGTTYVMWFFHQPQIIVSCVNDVPLLAHELQKEFVYTAVARLIGDGMITATPQKWKKSRSILNPEFNSPSSVAYFYRVFCQKSVRLVNTFKAKADTGETFNLWPYLINSMSGCIYETALGFSDDEIDEFMSHEKEEKKIIVSELIILSKMIPLMQCEWVRQIVLYVLGLSQIEKEIRANHERAIMRKKEKLNEEKKLGPKKESKRKPMFDILIEKHNLSNKELTDEMLTLLFAGGETTATTICFTLLNLAKYQDVQEKLYAELLDVVGDEDRLPEMEDCSRLKYLDQCIKETLRRYTIVPAISRKASQDITLSDGRVIPAGVDFAISVTQIHRDPDIYPSPLLWNPDNFAPENVAKRSPHAFLPFGFGPRLCIGYKFAMCAMKIVISSIVRKFKISTTQEKVTLKAGFVIKCVEGYNVQLSYR